MFDERRSKVVRNFGEADGRLYLPFEEKFE